MLDDITFGWWWTGTNSQSSTSKALTWIQCKLGKQYLEKKFTLPWESNPGPTPNRGDLATLVASVGLKKNLNIYKHRTLQGESSSHQGLWATEQSGCVSRHCGSVSHVTMHVANKTQKFSFMDTVINSFPWVGRPGWDRMSLPSNLSWPHQKLPHNI